MGYLYKCYVRLTCKQFNCLGNFDFARKKTKRWYINVKCSPDFTLDYNSVVIEKYDRFYLIE